MSGEEEWRPVEVSELPEIAVDRQPDLLVLATEDDGPIGWAIVLPDGHFWLIRNSSRALTHGSSLSVLTTFWASILDCEVGRPRLVGARDAERVRD
ncbi:hypothetical protein GCM10011608_19550 [Micromonospora sonchi]|uniref:Uncharacterized protein n=1 Tax=Micromonospora sonchi TaxID=1763543 RepID=A0A917TT73_9ACTN|nr:hypothetical protein [Micromonospora sonchi]GGM35044.1 hypothetical protein GCM10011608_19550 [Micromonospora sonchi]